MWDLSSAPRDRACAPGVGHTVLTTGPPGKSLQPQTSLLRTLPRISESGGSVEAGPPAFSLQPHPLCGFQSEVARVSLRWPHPSVCFLLSRHLGSERCLVLRCPATPRAGLVTGGCDFHAFTVTCLRPTPLSVSAGLTSVRKLSSVLPSFSPLSQG